MFIICPKCSAKYQIPDDVTLQDGQKLKCSACDFVFFKGEEAPLVLETPVVSESGNTVATSESASDEQAFSKPLYTKTGLSATPADSLPEAFQPVSTQPIKKGGLGMTFLYVAAVLGLCFAGWTFRDTLKPSIQDVMPAKPAVAHPVRQVASEPKMPVVSTPIAINEPQQVVRVDSLPSEVVVPELPPQTADITRKTARPVKPDILPPPVQEPEPFVEPTVEPVILPTAESTPVADPTPQVSVVPVSVTPPQAIIQPEIPALPIKPIAPAPNKLDNEDLADEKEDSLFEIVTDTTPIATLSDISIDRITFRIEPNEQGDNQLLIEGLIQNVTQTAKVLPALTVFVINQLGQIVADKKVYPDPHIMEPMQVVPFYTGITPAPVGVDHIEVRF